MKKLFSVKRFLSVLLTVAMLLGAAPLAFASGTISGNLEELSFRQTDADFRLRTDADRTTVTKEEHSPFETVRVAIELEKESTIKSGFDAVGIAKNASAMAYRASLKSYQDRMTEKINAKLGAKIDVKWNLTLAADVISADVRYYQIDAIRSVPGVRSVTVEKKHEQLAGGAADPNMATSGVQIGSGSVWAQGYTGAGSRIAIIDTGIDHDHISFDSGAFDHSLAQNAAEKGLGTDEYIASIDPLDLDELTDLAGKLNVTIEPESAYLGSKIPFSYNYVDGDYYTSHEKDEQSDHGSHVAGIAAANKYVPTEGGYETAIDTVFVQGVAPDAQIINMKVFGVGGGAYDSDYFVALEDAIILGCDSANLSLGSGYAGNSFSDGYEDVLNTLTENGIVVSCSAGNSNVWYSTAAYDGMLGGYIYSDDANYSTVGVPSTYENALSVGGVENSGKTGSPLAFGDIKVFFNESKYSNEPISTLAGLGEIGYVFIDGLGTAEEFAALADVLAGKVAICSRGDITFVEKGENAVAAGAIGTIVYNNQEGSINMDLSAYTGTAPMVSISQADGAAIRALSEEVVVDEETSYFTGTFTISTEIAAFPGEESDIQAIYEASSWGVPGSLTLKPEIVAPGGNIYSVNGLYKEENELKGGHDKYISYSGTSMAAPQISGIVALMAQYIKENGLCEKTGLSERQLATSLLMSTAHPIFEDYGSGYSGYYPVIATGAGLANVRDAIDARSYILMNEGSTMFASSAADGKVKAELGDDPARTGEYSYSFRIFPMDESKTFALGTDVFTQDLFAEEGEIYQDTWTMMIPAAVAYEIDGEIYANYSPYDADVNCDGVTDASDAQAILDLIAGKPGDEDLFDDYAADVDEDGAVTSYDAHLILASLRCPEITVTEPTDVTVYISIPDEYKEYFDYYYTGGTYIEGYTYVYPSSTEEGVLTDVTHSIPILGYYGSWTDASMFDYADSIEKSYGILKKPYFDTSANYLTIRRPGSESGEEFTGNPYAKDEAYSPERFAISSDSALSSVGYSLIRNAATVGIAAFDEDGKLLASRVLASSENGPYYNEKDAKWEENRSIEHKADLPVSGLGVSEGDFVTVAVVALPEYYTVLYNRAKGEAIASEGLDDEGFRTILESGTVGSGSMFGYTFKVDDTAPGVSAIYRDLETGNLIVRASDNNYVSFVAVSNKTGSAVFDSGIPDQSEAGEQTEITMNVGGMILPESVVVTVCDYAGNETKYEVDLGTSDDLGGKMLSFLGNSAVEIDPDGLWYDMNEKKGGGLSTYMDFGLAVTAAEYIDGHIIMAADDGYFYAAPANSLTEYEYAGYYANVTDYVLDMAYNYADGMLYVLGEENTIYAVDFITGEFLGAFSVTVPVIDSEREYLQEINGLAIDDAGTFYVTNCGGFTRAFLYKFTLDDVEDGEISELPPISENAMNVCNFSDGGGIAWDHDNDVLYIAGNYEAEETDVDHVLFTLDTATGIATPVNDKFGENSARFAQPLRGLVIIPSEVHVINPTDTAVGISADQSSYEMLLGQVTPVGVKVYPWTLTDKSVTWSSSDEEIVTVTEDGVMTANGVGEATVTVTTVAEPQLPFEIAITVKEAPVATIAGLVYDVDTHTYWSEFETNDPLNWRKIESGDSFKAGAIIDDTIYTVGDDGLYAIDADTYETEFLSPLDGALQFSDAASVPEDLAAQLEIGRLLGVNGKNVVAYDPETGGMKSWNVYADLNNQLLAVIAYAGRTAYFDNVENSICFDAAYYIVLTEQGTVYAMILSSFGNILFEEFGETGISLSGVSQHGNDRASLILDGMTGFLYLANYHYKDSTAYLYAIDAFDPVRNTCTGSFGDAVWPVVSLYQYEKATDLVLSVKPSSLSLFEGTTAQLKVKVKLGETGGYTIVSSDENVVTVDETGFVTAVGAGEAEITVTTNDVNLSGEKLTAVVKVNVLGYTSIDSTVTGAVTDGTGNHFANISLSDLSYEIVADAPGDVDVGGRGGNVYLVGVGGSAYALDAETYGPSSWKDLERSFFAAYPPLDIANYPVCADAEGELDETRFLFTTSLGWLVTPQYYGWDLSSYLPGMAAFAFGGASQEEDPETGETVDYYSYLLLTTDGMLYEIPVYYGYGELDIRPVASTGIKFADAGDASMTIIYDVNDSEEVVNCGAVIAVRSTGMVWYFDLLTNKCGLIGTVEGASFDALSGTFDSIDSLVEEESGEGGNRVTFSDVLNSAPPIASLKAERLVPAVQTREPAKTLVKIDGKIASVAFRPVEMRAIVAPVTDEETDGEIIFNFTEEEPVTNGVFTVGYDADLLTFAGAGSDVALVSANGADGVVTVAFASDAEIEAGETVCSLRFTYSGDYVSSTLTVTAAERNWEVALEEEPETVPFEKEDGGHDYVETDRTEPTCTEDGVINYECSKCHDLKDEIIPATGHSVEEIAEIPATCTADGVAAGKRCTVCGEILEGFGTIPATGHAWDEGTVEIEATCEGVGILHFTCANCDAVRDEVIRPYGHDFGEDGKAWRCSRCGVDNPDYKPAFVFEDVPADAFYAEPVAWAIANGVTSGTSSTKFSPNDPCTRAQIVTFMWRAAGCPAPETTDNPFEDVGEGSYYYEAVLWALENGITAGTSSTKFSPNDPCTRAQIVTFIWRQAGSPAPAATEIPFEDVKADGYYASAVLWAVENGVTSGTSATKFSPNGVCTRGQAVTFLYRTAE